ncbi:hypothetical protein RclHR1_32460002 [Rhizophagus clarus]|uniref:Uncharacterized protein n=1 Tax=Rhizophagus clarus TaxID=94130 RepID=A0A2Z6R8G7_9GLOM|nr:hypothetical protein RclHR1_32460002 [Rhizophagus clarus]GET00778.1 hypothetical protein RCL_e14616_RclHR1_32460002 [Rhizophagus clarus]
MVSTPFRLQHTQFSPTLPDLTLPGHTPLYSCMSPQVFKACLKVLRKRHLYYLSQLIAPSGSHLISWPAYRSAYIAQLEDKRGRSLPHKWYLDIKAHTTLPGSHDQLSDQYVRPLLLLLLLSYFLVSLQRKRIGIGSSRLMITVLLSSANNLASNPRKIPV